MTKLFVLALAGIASASVAQARPSTYNMTCAQAQSLVQQNGAVVMNYGYHPKAGHLYNRYVKSVSYCGGSEEVHAAWAPTTDNDRCRVGYTCEFRSRD